MRVAIITSIPVGGAGAVLRALVATPGVEVPYVVIASDGHVGTHWRQLRRKLMKSFRIGPLGALNGIRMRKWFDYSDPVDIRREARLAGVRIEEVSAVNNDRTVHILTADPLDLAISVGNGYIQEKVFSIPRYGMINYHGELLPEYPGALSVVWPIYFGLTRSGFTIHRIDRGIDTGDILMRREFDIVFGNSLRKTISATGAVIHSQMPAAIAEVVGNWNAVSASARPQHVTRRFTTPTFTEYLRMEANNRTLYREKTGGAAVPRTDSPR